MSHLLREFGPVGLVCGMAVWCCWGLAFEEAGFQLDDGDTLPTLQMSQLRPEFPAASQRDPFKAKQPPPKVVEVVPDLPDSAPDLPPERQVNPVDILAELRLEATYLDGERRVALINRNTFHVGDVLRHEVARDLPCEIIDIETQQVLMRIDGDTYALQYPGYGREHYVLIDSGNTHPPDATNWSLRKLWSWGTALRRNGTPPLPADDTPSPSFPEGTTP